MAKMFGQATVSMNGQQLLIAEGAKLNTGGTKRNTVKGSKVYGNSEEPMEATVECDIYLDSTVDLDVINNMADGTVQFACDTGQTYVLPHAWTAEPVDLSAANNGGKAKIKFAAATSEQL